MGYSTFLSKFWSQCTVSRLQGTRFRDWGAYGFESMGYMVSEVQSTGYIVSHNLAGEEDSFAHPTTTPPNDPGQWLLVTV